MRCGLEIRVESAELGPLTALAPLSTCEDRTRERAVSCLEAAAAIKRFDRNVDRNLERFLARAAALP